MQGDQQMFEGAYTAIVTPFDRKGQVAMASYAS